MRILFTCWLVLYTITLYAQTASIEGYIYEAGNRGYISGVSITIEDIETDKIIGKALTDLDGFFSLDVPPNSNLRIYAAKDMYDVKKVETEIGTGKSFIKMAMGRAPGYTFEVTLAEKRPYPNAVVDALTGTRIEVYNNTTKESIMDLKDHDVPTFQLNLKKGNHYTILLRKNGFLSKRMEAKVDVEGCILCFEGVGKVGPGVADNLTEGNAFGVLLANVEMERIFEGKKMEVENLYYKLGKWGLIYSARRELNKVITLMKDNPNLTLELGSHTDSRGRSNFNLELSKKRANSAVDYLIRKGGISKSRIVSKGYGETDLVNDCGNGATCSEDEHAVNRRTELKIVGITDVANVKSLAQMKKEEQLEAEILDLMDQEQIQAKDEDELQKILNNRKEMDSPQEEEEEEEVVSETENTLSTMQTSLIEETKQVVEEIEVLTTIEEQVSSTIDTSITEIQEEEVVILEQEVKMKEYIEDKINSEETDRIEEQELNEEQTTAPITNTESDNTIPFSESYTDGIKIIIHETAHPLSDDHFIRLRHHNAETFQSKDGMIQYMLGGFRTTEKATAFLKSYLLPDKKYEKPYVAILKEGILKKIPLAKHK